MRVLSDPSVQPAACRRGGNGGQGGGSHYLDNLDKAREHWVARNGDERQVRKYVRYHHGRQRRYDRAFPAARAAPHARGPVLRAALGGILAARECAAAAAVVSIPKSPPVARGGGDQLLLTVPPVTWFESPTTSCQLLLHTFHSVSLPSKMQAYSRGSHQAQSELTWFPHGSGPCPHALPGPCLLSEPCSTADQVCFWLTPEQSSGLLDSKELGPRTVHVTKIEGPCFQPS